jgi:hypothetical protein
MRCLTRRARADSCHTLFLFFTYTQGTYGTRLFLFLFFFPLLFHLWVGASVGGCFYRMWSFVFHSCDIVLSNEHGARRPVDKYGFDSLQLYQTLLQNANSESF